MILVTLLFVLIGVSAALPTLEVQNRNVITVPPNCPPGQVWANGKCREIWQQIVPDLGVNYPSAVPRNVITVPTNCPPGQEFINGACRDVWRLMKITTPLPRTARNLDLTLRDRRQVDTEGNEVDSLEMSDPNRRNIINIPNQCPIGYRPDALGNCRAILN